ncbi:hypothetical protein ABTX81_30440 [Kitasatospora sp. NPDC097605]|uniref:hypothetical protein n=1 Tax=Kitasatospora sp. NPDC097605 TaxID=3157226 RepID=UPI0033282049
MSAPTTELLNRCRRLTRRPWSRWTRTGRALAALLDHTHQEAIRQREHATATGLPHTIVAVDTGRPDHDTATAVTTLGNAVLRRNLLAPLSITVGPRVVRVALRPQTLGQWDKWVAAINAGPTTNKGSWAQAKGAIGGVPVIIVGYDVTALAAAELRARTSR